MKYCVVDVETTGLDPAHHEVVEVAAAHFDTTISVFSEPVALESYTSLANPGKPIPPEVSGIHLITDRHVADAPPAATVRRTLATFVGDEALIIAHNAPFDRGFLPELSHKRWLCSMRLARHLYPDAPNYKNSTLRFYLEGVESDCLSGYLAHRAYGDVLVTARIFAKELKDCAALGLEGPEDVAAFEASPVPVEHFRYGRKHYGARIAEIPRSYLTWVLQDASSPEPFMRLDADTLAALRAILALPRVGSAA